MEQPGEALALAEDWRLVLTDLKIPDSDLRIPKLEATIQLLRDKVLPEPQPEPPEVNRFLEQVRALTEAMKSLQSDRRIDAPGLTTGRAAIDRADQLLGQHAEVLNPIAGTFRELRAAFRKIANLIEGIKPIEELLKTAKEHVDSGRPTEALETLAQARLVNLATELDTSQREKLAKLHDAIVNGPLQRALCLRSLSQADQATHTGDRHAREWLVKDAQTQLDMASSRDPNSDPTPLVSRLKTLKDAMKDSSPAGPGRSLRIPEFEARRAYEKAIEAFATWHIHDSSRWIECARDFDQVSRLPSAKLAWLDRLASLYLLAVRVRLDLLRGPDDTKAAGTLKDVNEALTEIRRWESRPDYRLLLVEVRRRGTEYARNLLDHAEQQSRDGNLDDAMTSAEAAKPLSSPSDAARAKTLIERCKAEIALRRDQKAQEEAWLAVKALIDKHEAVDIWVALAGFERRFPDSARAREIVALRQSLDAEVRRQIPALLKQCDDYSRDRRLADYRRAVQRLETLGRVPENRGFESIPQPSRGTRSGTSISIRPSPRPETDMHASRAY